MFFKGNNNCGRHKGVRVFVGVIMSLSMVLSVSSSVMAVKVGTQEYSNLARYTGAQYAQAWSNNKGSNYRQGLRNPKFPDNQDMDCANFVSQCLLNSLAYLPEDNWQKPTKNPYNVNFWRQTAEWCNAEALVNRFVLKKYAYPSKTFTAKQANDLKGDKTFFTGDIIGYKWNGKGPLNHVAFISKGSYYNLPKNNPGYGQEWYGKVGSKNVKVCAHSSERRNQHWSLYAHMSPEVKGKAVVTQYRFGYGITY